ncbi:uncharacterized protein LOC108864416 [Galendromus occidentalis]|uniref:Uncharacterized protein LOC108864416 n=1 Tax=Galendromus occidentalis TaxID=34638 RepID=A0AAJ7L6M5_9ACAR|nr:uncharacterized protein LOC108864416 [Galendromus occidentalis]
MVTLTEDSPPPTRFDPRLEPRQSKTSRDASIDDDLKFLWEGKILGVDTAKPKETNPLSDELDSFLERTVERRPDGRLRLSPPFKDNLDALGDNGNLTCSRVHSSLKKLRKSLEKLQAVDNKISEYLQRGFAEETPPPKPNQRRHNLPLRAVFKIDQEGLRIIKTRVVKDAGARRSHEAALNDCLRQGENLLPLIPRVLCAFRECRFAITADIEKAFLQFEIAPSDRTFLRFKWPLGISGKPNASIEEFQARILDFGLICSPWLHIEGAQYHLKDCKKQFPSDAEFIEEISANLKPIFRKWGTADEDVDRSIVELSPLEHTLVTVGEEDAKFLGVQWHQPTDSLGVFTRKALSELSSGTPSKRKLLKGLAQIYDPLGVLTPVTVRAKTLLQSLWKLKMNRDDPLPTDVTESYQNFIAMLRQSADIRVERALSPRLSTATFELHASCDASLEAKLTDYRTWRYIKSEENPADILSRGTDISNTQSRYRWLSGPIWLSNPGWKVATEQIDVEETAEERKTALTQCLYTVRDNGNNVVDDILDPTRFPSWFKLIRAQAFRNRLKTFAQSIKLRRRRSHLRSETRSLRPDTSECQQAEKDRVRRIQGRYFPEGISNRCENLPKSSVLAQFHRSLDPEGLVRCKSRLERSTPGHCPGCKRFNAKPAAEPTPALPAFRVEITPPSLFTGVDLAGPLHYKSENGRKAKSYILLFTCAVSRAISIGTHDGLVNMAASGYGAVLQPEKGGLFMGGPIYAGRASIDPDKRNELKRRALTNKAFRGRIFVVKQETSELPVDRNSPSIAFKTATSESI